MNNVRGWAGPPVAIKPDLLYQSFHHFCCGWLLLTYEHVSHRYHMGLDRDEHVAVLESQRSVPPAAAASGTWSGETPKCQAPALRLVFEAKVHLLSGAHCFVNQGCCELPLPTLAGPAGHATCARAPGIGRCHSYVHMLSVQHVITCIHPHSPSYIPAWDNKGKLYLNVMGLKGERDLLLLLSFCW